MNSTLNYLEKLVQQEIISRVELEFARFLYSLKPDVPEEVLLAGAATVNAQLNGHICLDLNNLQDSFLFGSQESGVTLSEKIIQGLLDRVEASALVGNGSELKPLILEGKRLYLHKLWKFENELAEWIQVKSEIAHALSESDKKIIQSFFGGRTLFEPINWQSVALCQAFIKDLLFVSGGPGTGKTYTVLNIISALKKANQDKRYRIALAAPTGKAARRLAASILKGKAGLSEQVSDESELPAEASTVHKLLGADYHGSTFKYGRENKLPYDLIVVDEASMLDINMWVRLIRAIPEHAKLILLGDKDQLASVEAGSILGDICQGNNTFSAETAASLSSVIGSDIPVSDRLPSVNDCIIFLNKSYRFDEKSGIKNLAEAINNSDAESVLELFDHPDFPDLRLMDSTSANFDKVMEEYVINHYKRYSSVPEEENTAASNKKKILCALRSGPLGVERINIISEKRIKKEFHPVQYGEWYPNRIVMSKANNSILKIRNGEIGICLKKGSEYKIYFEGERSLPVSANRLSEYEPAYSVTIHKSQGSEFDDVAIVLPDRSNELLSKELLYTSVTRARRTVLVIGNRDIIRNTIQHSISRNSGLSLKIWKKN